MERLSKVSQAVILAARHCQEKNRILFGSVLTFSKYLSSLSGGALFAPKSKHFAKVSFDCAMLRSGRKDFKFFEK
jgi:hypothetical protein